MSSASAGQLDSFLSFKSTPEVEVDSLQLNKEQAKSASPKLKSESPLLDGLFDPKIGLASLDEKLSIPNEEQMKSNPDETIQHDIPHISKEPAELLSPTNIGSKDQKKKDQPPEKSLPIPESHQDADIKLEHEDDNSKVSAYARLEFENFIFYVQTLQVVLGRKSENDHSHSVDVHLGNSKAISRKHAKIFYNFGTERFELSIQGKNGAFVDDVFIERGATVPLTNKSKVQIGQIVFRFVLPGMNPQEKLESPSKPINPADAISLRSSLYHHSSTENVQDKSGSNTPGLSSKDFEPVSTVTSSTTTDNAAAQKKSKEKKTPKPPKPPKKVYTLEEIPEEYRTKPNCSYSNLIATCLRTHGTPKGMSLAEIYKSIKELFPYYKYCPDGWQSSVRHNLSLNKAFRKVSKEGKGWLWGLDEEYCAEKERAKKKQAAAAAAKAKAAALKLEQQQLQQQKLQQQRLEQQKQMQINQASQPQLQQQQSPLQQQQQQQQQQKDGQIPPTQGLSTNPAAQSIPLQSPAITQQQKLSQITLQNTKPPSTPAQNPLTNQQIQNPQQPQPQQSTIHQTQHQPQPQPQAILTPTQPKFTPQPQSSQLPPPPQALSQLQNQAPVQPNKQPQFHPQQQQHQPSPQIQPQFQHQQQLPPQQFVPQYNKATQPTPSPYQNKTPSIQAQLAANRGITPQASRPLSLPPQPTPKPPPTGLTADTKKALAHLQQQLVVLSKDLKTLVDRPTISAILTQAIAMTIAQVTQAAKTKGITSDPLATLIETNPQQLTRILTVALNAATFKVTNGRIKAPLSISPSVENSAANSRAGTPALPQHSPPPPASLQQHVPSPTVSKIPIQPIQHQQPQLQQQQVHIKQEKAQQNRNQLPAPQTQYSSQPTKQFQAGAHNNMQQINVVQPQPVKTQSNPLLSNHPPVNLNSGAQTQPPTPNAAKVQPVQRANFTIGAPSQTAPNPVFNNINHPLPNVSTAQQQVPSNNSFASNVQGQSLKQPQTEPSTPQLQKAQPIAPQTAPQNRPASQPNVNVDLAKSNVGTQGSIAQPFSVGSAPTNAIPGPKPQVQTQTPQLQAQAQPPPQAQPPQAQQQPYPPALPATAPAPVQVQPQPQFQQSQSNVISQASSGTQSTASVSIPVNNQHNDVQVKMESKPVEAEIPKAKDTEPTPTVKVEPFVNNENQNEAPDLSFLDNDLNDEEFDKVLKSLSKEGTPAVEGDDKVMDADELNRLLSSDFTQSYEPNTDTNGSRKRSFEDANLSIDESHNDKIARTEQ